MCFNSEKGPYDEEINALGGTIYRVSPVSRNIKSFKKHKIDLISFIKNHNYDIIHVHGNTAINLMDIPNLKRYSNSIIIAHSHNNGVGSIRQRILHAFFRRRIKKFIDYRFACSKSAWNWMFFKPFKEKRDSIIPNGIKSDLFVFNSEKRASIRKEIGIDDSSILIGSVGRLTKQKNYPFLLKVFFELLTSKKGNYKLIIVGDGASKDSLLKQAEELGIGNKVIFTGSVVNVSDYYLAMDVFVLCSSWEGLGICLLEAQASGLPCVVSSAIVDEALLDGFKNIRMKSNSSIREWSEAICSTTPLSDNDRINYNYLFKNSCFDETNSVKMISHIYLNVNTDNKQ